MHKFHVKKGDEVVVIAGAEKGKRGKIIQILRKKERVLVEGVKMVKKHMRKSQQHPQGSIITREAAIHLSNVMLAAKFEARQARRGAPAGAS
ncbi:MAG: 50S ribosomal protein L24 [Verrucomicrobia bacterium]|nr:50S ribosomal protein L24 [Verrucomicrobiota bacterium]